MGTVPEVVAREVGDGDDGDDERSGPADVRAENLVPVEVQQARGSDGDGVAEDGREDLLLHGQVRQHGDERGGDDARDDGDHDPRAGEDVGLHHSDDEEAHQQRGEGRLDVVATGGGTGVAGGHF